MKGQTEFAHIADERLARAAAADDRNWAMLSLSLQACIDDHCPQANLVIGPPGIGKSRLRHEFLRRCEQQHDLSVLLAFGDPIRSAASCGLIGQALTRLCDLRLDASPEENHARLSQRLQHVEEDLELLLTLVRDIWAISLGETEGTLVHIDLFHDLAKIADDASPRKLSGLMTRIELLRERFVVNINRKLAADALFVEMAA